MDIGRMNHKEYGSEFYFPIAPQWCLDNAKDSSFLSQVIPLFFSGRAALHHLLVHGIKTRGWEDVYLPSYYCHEVYRFLIHLPIRVHYYPFNPLYDTKIASDDAPDSSNCVLVNVSFFGMDLADTTHFTETVVIEDISHNLQAIKTSGAQYCFGSLRKELPMPVGGFCFSPLGYSIPKGIQNHESEIVTEQKINAMQHKYNYLKGIHEDKNIYRTLFAGAEAQFEASFTQAALPKKAMDILQLLDMDAILLQKRKNLEQAIAELEGIPGLQLLGGKDNSPSFGLVLHCDTPQDRNLLKTHLVRNHIFPAVLWPDQTKKRDKILEDGLLFIHTDFRYNAKDISVITQAIKTHYKHD